MLRFDNFFFFQSAIVLNSFCCLGFLPFRFASRLTNFHGTPSLLPDGGQMGEEAALRVLQYVRRGLLDDGGAELGVEAAGHLLLLLVDSTPAALDADNVGALGAGRRLEGLLMSPESAGNVKGQCHGKRYTFFVDIYKRLSYDETTISDAVNQQRQDKF